MKKGPLDSELTLLNVFFAMYAKCRFLLNAEGVFDNASVHDVGVMNLNYFRIFSSTEAWGGYSLFS